MRIWRLPQTGKCWCRRRCPSGCWRRVHFLVGAGSANQAREAPLTAAVILGSLLVVAAWEFFWPRRRREFPALRRRFANIGFWVINLLLIALLLEAPERARPQIETVFDAHLPSWPIADVGLSFLLGFLLLDLLHYLVHRCEHAVPLFWRFHALHHSDPDVDVTTSVRHHPIEYVFGSAVYWVAIILLDVPTVAVAAHGLALFGTAAFQHGNVRLPEWVEQRLQWVLVTFDMHRIHHSVVFDQGNSNYGAVLSIWDRFLGTYTKLSRAQHDKIVFGVRELPWRDCLKPSKMMLTPWLLPRATAAPSAEVRTRGRLSR